MLAGLMAASKKMRTTRGALATVEPSMGSEPITKACAYATGCETSKLDQLSSRRMVLSTMNSSLLFKECICDIACLMKKGYFSHLTNALYLSWDLLAIFVFTPGSCYNGTENVIFRGRHMRKARWYHS